MALLLSVFEFLMMLVQHLDEVLYDLRVASRAATKDAERINWTGLIRENGMV